MEGVTPEDRELRLKDRGQEGPALSFITGHWAPKEAHPEFPPLPALEAHFPEWRASKRNHAAARQEKA